jgi:hypothetical protein
VEIGAGLRYRWRAVVVFFSDSGFLVCRFHDVTLARIEKRVELQDGASHRTRGSMPAARCPKPADCGRRGDDGYDNHPEEKHDTTNDVHLFLGT